MEHENQANPFEVRRNLIARWKGEAVADVEETDAIILQAREIAERGMLATNALHAACAVAAGCDFFLTTDYLIVKRMRGFAHIAVMNPAQFIVEVE
ncbi:MAG: hypothetical protein JW959_03485 [Pirellulales bacterium]|nr:hypothetical protein [Pirellulales bacterium]